jgi:hypothetical protein
VNEQALTKMMMSTSSSKPIRHSKLLSGSLDLSDADITSITNQNMRPDYKDKKHSLTNKTLIDTSQFDSKSFINRSDGFANRSLNFGISKSDKSLDKAKNKSGNMVPILIVSKSKKLINKYQQLDAAKKTKLNYIKNLQNAELKLPQKQFSPQELFKATSHQQLSSDRENYNYDFSKQVTNKINHFTNKVGLNVKLESILLLYCICSYFLLGVISRFFSY